MWTSWGGGWIEVFAYPTSNVEAQDIVDYVEANGTAAISKDNVLYYFDNIKTISDWYLYNFYSSWIKKQLSANNETSEIDVPLVVIGTDTNKDVSWYSDWDSPIANVLDTTVSYPTTYTPLYAWSPVTKAYVDQKANSKAPYLLIAKNVWDGSVELRWKDPQDAETYPANTRVETIVVRKTGSFPTSPSDWTVVLTETTRDNYYSTSYYDTWASLGDYNYYRIFAKFSDNVYYYTDAVIEVFETWTFTVTWEEKADATQWTNVYSDDAEGLTAWSTDFDAFLWYSAVLLDDTGTEVAEVTQAESWWPWKLDISLLAAKGIIDGSSNSTNNVMIKFPRRWIKMSRNWNFVTLSITRERNKTWYQYYAFNDNWVTKNALYIGAYQWYTDNNTKLRSISWTTPDLWTTSLSTYVTAANNMGTWYHEVTWYARQLLNAYYKMKYDSPDSQAMIGIWYLGSTAQTTWTTNSISNSTWATDTTNTWRIKLFGLEDWRWNSRDVLEWCKSSWSTTIYTSSTWAFLTTWPITTFDKTLTCVSGRWNIQSIAWDNDWMFMAIQQDGGYHNSNYYCDFCYIYTGSGITDIIGWGWIGEVNNRPWVFMYYSASQGGYSKRGGRLIYL